MAKNLEIEYKNILSQAEYERLFNHYHFADTAPLIQENIYFDTADGELQKRHIGLRVRITDRYVHLTMKQPVKDHQKLETTEKLTKPDGEAIKENGKLPYGGEVADFLASIDVALNDLIVIGQFKTVRHQQEIDGQDMVLDHCFFSNFEDYELEIETNDPETGMIFYENLLQKFKIQQRPIKQKIVRMNQLQADPLG
ncbi:CYTH domain-containing protein [Aerococcaceae bacterium 50-4]